MCNVAYASQADGMDEDAVERFDIEIGQVANPADEAKAALKAHQDAMGLEFEHPDQPVPGVAPEAFGG